MVATARVALEAVTATLPAIATVVVVGNPNCGKSTLFNQLTGLRQKTANYPGVTVEKRLGKMIIDGRALELLDLPGTYALTSYSSDEAVTVDVLLGRLSGTQAPDAILAVADATRLYQSLFLIQQLIELQFPIVVALTMVDAAAREGVRIDASALQSKLGVPVCSVVATTGKGVPELKRVLRDAVICETAEPRCFWPQIRGVVERFRADLGPGAESASLFEIERALVDQDPHSVEHLQQYSAEPIRERLARMGRESFGNVPPLVVEARQRHAQSRQLLSEVQTSVPRLTRWHSKVSDWLHKPVPAALLFLTIMALVFQAVFAWATPFMDLIDGATVTMGVWLGEVLPPGMLASLLIDGVIAGVGSVVIFLPQILILFLFIIVLEDTGYLARAAFLADRGMRGLGLSGQSVIPLLSSFACAVPGIMAARVIPDRRDRIATILAAPFMTCSARLPVYALLIAAFVPQITIGFANLQGLVLFGLYLLGILGGVVTAFMLKRSALRGPVPTFMLALPEFRIPSLRTVLIKLLDRARIFLRRAGTVIFTVAVVVWGLSYFPRSEDVAAEREQALIAATAALQGDALAEAYAEINNETAAKQLAQSWLGRAGRFVEPVFEPLGWDWRVSAAVIAGFPAREVVVAVIGTIYAVGADADETRLADRLRSAAWPDGRPVFTLPMVLGLLVFYAWCLQCAATLAVMRRETNSWRWPLFGWSYMTLLGYSGALLIFQLG